ncbi:MAG: protein phosphatase CheZ [Azospirillaceae bacterium]|nr:protein phosphatase CheZ [Azospirillaceae bacterium]
MVDQSRRPFMAELQYKKRQRPAGNGAVPVEAAQPEVVAPPQIIVAPADNGEVLRAIADLSSKFDRFLATDKTQIESIQLEIEDIAGRIKATKAEMAALRHPLANEDKFQQASEELSAVVSATEDATNVIMASAEEMEEIIAELKAQLPDGYQSSRVNDMNEIVVRIFEACNFQDLTGQRITKVVRALSFIEERVDAMMSVWNRREFESMPLPPDVSHHDGDLELHGPHKEDKNKGMISQADIDALFG